MSDSFFEDLSCLTILCRFLQEHVTATKNVVLNSSSELLLNLHDVVFTDPKNARPKQVIVKAETDPRSVQHPFSRKWKHQTSLALIAASGNCSYHMLITFIDIYGNMVEKKISPNPNDHVHNTKTALYDRFALQTLHGDRHNNIDQNCSAFSIVSRKICWFHDKYVF